MIIAIAMSLVLGLILAVSWWFELKKNKELEVCNNALRQEISKLKLSDSAEQKDAVTEQGNFVRTRKLQRATPETYRNMFDMDLNGQRILEHLTNVFCKDAFVSNDKGGERETCYRLGQQSVINFIILNINQANSPLYKEQDND